MIESLPWHQPVINRLLDLAATNQLPNAIALSCAPGWGHGDLLVEVALGLLEVKTNASIAEFAHPDFRWIVPDGAAIKVEQVRRLRDFAVQTRQSAPRKVAAVLDAHLLNVNAANALLKTLEEPPANTHVLLATSNWGKLLPTVRSRCQRFQVQPDQTVAQHWLGEQGINLKDAQFAEFGYAPLTAAAAIEEQLDLTLWISRLADVDLEEAVAPILSSNVVACLARWYRRILGHLQGDVIPSCGVAHRSLFVFADELLSARRQIESSNAANSRLLLEGLIVQWVQLQRQAGH